MMYNRPLTQVWNPIDSGESAAVEMPLGHAKLFQRGAVCWFRKARLTLALATVLVASVCLPLPLYAPIIPTFTAGGDDFLISGGSVIVPITVTSFVGLTSAQFSLSWDAGVLQCVATGSYNQQLFGSGIFTFSTNNSVGQLGFLWDGSSGQTLSDPSTIFTVQFTAVGSPGTQTAVSFGNTPTRSRVSDGTTEGIPNVVNGGPITVVPEPVDWALGVFTCVFISGATVRWVSNRKMALRIARTVSQGGPQA